MSAKRGAPAPAVVGSHFVKQYYGEVLSKKPVELHRFYKDESTFCHASGTKEEEPVSGLADIRAKIEHLGLGGAMVDLGCGSVDAQPSEGGGVLLMVTGSITISGMDPRQFCQTFFLSRQYQDNDRHNYFVRNDIFRFLDVLPEVVQAALRSRDDDDDDNEAEGDLASTASVEQADDITETVVEAVDQEMGVIEDSVASTAAAAADDVAPSASVDVTQASPVVSPSVKPATAPAVTPAPMAAGAAPPSESQVAASSSPAVGTTGATRSPSVAGVVARAGGVTSVVTSVVTSAALELENGVIGKLPAAKAASSTTSAPADLSPETVVPALSGPASTVPPPPPPAAPAAPPASPATRAPPAPSAPMTYASLAKSWATVAAVSGDAAAPSLSTAGGAPASSSSIPAGTGSAAASGNGVVVTPASNGGWGIPDAAAGGLGVGIAETMTTTINSTASQVGGASAGGQGSSRPSSLTGKKGSAAHIPHHASPAVAASAAAAREAAAAGNGEILPATSLFVRKVDMTIDKEEMIAHFSTFGAVTGISMNPTRGYAFIDYRNNECVQRALSTKEHYVNRKLLVVEERHSPIVPRSSRDHSGRGGRNGPRGRGIGGRDGREGDRGDRSDRRSTGGRMTRGNLGRESLGRENRADSKEGGSFKPRGRAMPA